MKEYKLKKGLVKGVVSALTFLGALIAFTSFADVSLWALLETYLKPVLGGITVSGLITMAINYGKIKLQS